MVHPCERHNVTKIFYMNSVNSIRKKQASRQEWVRESRFGQWFQTTDIWYDYVLSEAIFDFTQLLGHSISETRQLLDIGCHQGLAFQLLEEHFQPKTIIGVDIDQEQVTLALKAAARCHCHVKCKQGTVYNLELPDNSIDLIFCHQLLHHLSDQTSGLDELYRVLVPGGVLLLGESCRSFLDLFWVRLFFRHPKQIQKTAQEFFELVKLRGFHVGDGDIKASNPWWGQKDLGVTEKIGLPQKPQEPTEVLMVARKPF